MTDKANRPETAADLAALIESLTNFDHDGGEGGYSQSAEAMWKAALAAFNYAASKVGATGFQASWAALRFYGEAMHVTGPFMVVKVEDALYPQYDVVGRVGDFVAEHRPWLAEKAREKLAGPSAEHAVPAVIDHWRSLARDGATR